VCMGAAVGVEMQRAAAEAGTDGSGGGRRWLEWLCARLPVEGRGRPVVEAAEAGPAGGRGWSGRC
jgi:hypothetical protein